jgi:cytidylate kinase
MSVRFNKHTADVVITALSAGVTLREAAAHAGLTLEDAQRWMERHPIFAERVTGTQASIKVLAVGKVRMAMSEDWKAAAYFLDRQETIAELERMRELTTDAR